MDQTFHALDQAFAAIGSILRGRFSYWYDTFREVTRAHTGEGRPMTAIVGFPSKPVRELFIDRYLDEMTEDERESARVFYLLRTSGLIDLRLLLEPDAKVIVAAVGGLAGDASSMDPQHGPFELIKRLEGRGGRLLVLTDSAETLLAWAPLFDNALYISDLRDQPVGYRLGARLHQA